MRDAHWVAKARIVSAWLEAWLLSASACEFALADSSLASVFCTSLMRERTLTVVFCGSTTCASPTEIGSTPTLVAGARPARIAFSASASFAFGPTSSSKVNPATALTAPESVCSRFLVASSSEPP